MKLFLLCIMLALECDSMHSLCN